jgi:DNA-binding GntR family transcriptional regulator
MDDDPVVQGILTAISQKRLKPGAKLGEDRLARAFGTTRIHIRQALAHLASRKIVKQFPNRGAFVYRPTWEEAREMFAARSVIEAATVSAVIDRLDKPGRDALKRHMKREAGHDRNDRWASLSLTAEFHVLIAELAGNRVLLDMTRELMLRTSLAIATFERPGSQDCSPDAHPGIGELILARDKAGRDPRDEASSRGDRAAHQAGRDQDRSRRPHHDLPGDPCPSGRAGGCVASNTE